MSKKILVIDDEPDVIHMIKARLEKNQFTVVTASDGVEGLQKVDDESPDLIVLDVMMPKMDGYTFIKQLKVKQQSNLTPVIVLTAKGQLKDMFEMEGVSDYLTKPFQGHELLDKINLHVK
jgi:DNA-binding response OmpR family regulator